MNAHRHGSWSIGLLCILTAALGAEITALFALLNEDALHALAWHMLAALASALGGARTADSVKDARPAFAAIVAFALVATLPGLGLLGLTWVLLPHWAKARSHDPDGVLELELPAFHETDQITVDLERGLGSIEEDLSIDRPVERRVQAVMALRRMDPQRAVPLLRVALGDPSEDVRLLAYAILERREKQIRKRITRALTALRSEGSTTSLERAALLRELANDHWELVYGGFSEGDGMARNLELAAHWTEEALRAGFHGTTALLLARIRLKQGNGAEARRSIQAAEAAGIAPRVCAPLLAEAAFLLREFERIPQLLAHVDGDPLQPPRLQPVARFWSSGGLR